MKIPVDIHRPKQMTLSMTSMIDVVFLLLIFFVCTANFSLQEERLPMNLSRPGTIADVVKPTSEEIDFKFATLRISRQEGAVQWQINDRLCQSLNEVASVLQQLATIKSDLPILIDMDDDIAWEHFIHIYDLARATGLSRVQLVGEDKQ